MQAFNKDELHTSYMDRCVCVCVYTCMRAVTQSCPTLCNQLFAHGLQHSRLLGPWDSPGKETGVGCISFSRESSQLRGRTHTPASPALTGRFPLLCHLRSPHICATLGFFLCVHKNIDEYTQKRRDSKKLGYFHFL